MKYDTIVKSYNTLIEIHGLSSAKIDFPFQREWPGRWMLLALLSSRKCGDQSSSSVWLVKHTCGYACKGISKKDELMEKEDPPWRGALPSHGIGPWTNQKGANDWSSSFSASQPVSTWIAFFVLLSSPWLTWFSGNMNNIDHFFLKLFLSGTVITTTQKIIANTDHHCQERHQCCN